MALTFMYRLDLEDRTPADPPTFRSAPGVTWSAGDTIPLGHGRRLLVIATRPPNEPDGELVLVVEPA